MRARSWRIVERILATVLVAAQPSTGLAQVVAIQPVAAPLSAPAAYAGVFLGGVSGAKAGQGAALTEPFLSGSLPSLSKSHAYIPMLPAGNPAAPAAAAPSALPGKAIQAVFSRPASLASPVLQAPGAAAVRTKASPLKTSDTAVRHVAGGLRSLGERLAPITGRSLDPGTVRGVLGGVFDAARKADDDGAVEAPPAVSLAGRVPGLSPSVRPLASIDRLRVGTYNVLNLFQQVGKHVPDPKNPGKLKKVSPAREKEEWALRAEARAISDSDLDIVTLEEVENIQALDDFNEKYLGGRYRTFLIEGNDERGIDVAFLVKKDLPLDIEHRTHKDELWTDPVLGGEPRPLFSRDLPEMIVRAQGFGKPLFVLFGTHFKSKRDRPGDPASRIIAKAQAERAADLVEAARREFGADVPILLAGDFNGDVNADETFAALWERAGLIDSLGLGEAPVLPADRVTHTYHPKDGPTHAAQMDAVIVSKGMRGLVRKAEIYRYKNADGTPKPIPRTYAERGQNPSDHFPLFVTLDFQPLVQRALP